MRSGPRIDEAMPAYGFGLPIAAELTKLCGEGPDLSRAAKGGLRVRVPLPKTPWTNGQVERTNRTIRMRPSGASAMRATTKSASTLPTSSTGAAALTSSTGAIAFLLSQRHA